MDSESSYPDESFGDHLAQFGFMIPLGAALGTALAAVWLLAAAALGWKLGISAAGAIQGLLAAASVLLCYGPFWRKPSRPDPLSMRLGVLFGFTAALAVIWMASSTG